MLDLTEIRKAVLDNNSSPCPECGFQYETYRHQLGCTKPTDALQRNYREYVPALIEEVERLQREVEWFKLKTPECYKVMQSWLYKHDLPLTEGTPCPR